MNDISNKKRKSGFSLTKQNKKIRMPAQKGAVLVFIVAAAAVVVAVVIVVVSPCL